MTKAYAVENTIVQIMAALEKRKETCAHAESILLAYHLQHPNTNTSYAMGCNKLSCYWCSLYIRSTTPRFYTTGSHDHLWPWHPPVTPPAETQQKMIKEALDILGCYIAIRTTRSRTLSESTSGSGAGVSFFATPRFLEFTILGDKVRIF